MKKIAFLGLLIAGCGKHLPIEIHIDKTFNPSDRAMIEEAIVEWNERGSKRLAHKTGLFVIRDDVDAFSVGQSFTDGISGFYRADYQADNPPNTKMGDIFGYTTLTDLLFYADFVHARVDRFKNDDGSDLDPEIKQKIDYFVFKKSVFHELGHLLEIIHFTNRIGVMNPGLVKDIDLDLGPHLFESDLDAFCILYDCK